MDVPDDTAATPVASEAPAALDADLIGRLIAESGAGWDDVDVRQVTGSTNSDLVGRIREGTADHGSIVVAASQTQGRGRLGRHWESPPGSLAWSVALRAPTAQQVFIPLLLGLAARDGISWTTGVGLDLKWPNDLLIDGGKVGGILSERSGDLVVAGCGINVGVAASDLRAPEATSLADHGADQSRELVLTACLTALHEAYDQWAEAGFSPSASGLLDQYRGRCITLGQDVSVRLPGDEVVRGTAAELDDAGRLVLRTGGERRTIDVGDVTHLRRS